MSNINWNNHYFIFFRLSINVNSSMGTVNNNIQYHFSLMIKPFRNTTAFAIADKSIATPRFETVCGFRDITSFYQEKKNTGKTTRA